MWHGAVMTWEGAWPSLTNVSFGLLFYDAFIFTAVISAFEDGETRLDRNDSIRVVSDPSPKPRALAILNAVAIDDFVDLIGIGSKRPCHFGDVVDRGRCRNHFASDEDPK
jgi:hypothetical protein